MKAFASALLFLVASMGHSEIRNERDFFAWAEVFRSTRITLGHERFQDNYTLGVAVTAAMDILHQDNP